MWKTRPRGYYFVAVSISCRQNGGIANYEEINMYAFRLNSILGVNSVDAYDFRLDCFGDDFRAAAA